MWRVLGFLGIAILFLTISSKFRGQVIGLLAAFVQLLAHYSPISYVIFGAFCLFAFLIFVSRGSRPR